MHNPKPKSDPVVLPDVCPEGQQCGPLGGDGAGSTAIYCCYSTADKQNESIERQVDMNHAYMKQIGAEPASTTYAFADRNCSGETLDDGPRMYDLKDKADLFVLPNVWSEGQQCEPPGGGSGAVRAVIYCRYSTADEREVSIERQVDASHAYMKRIGAEPASTTYIYVDRKCSGATMDDRPGLKDLIAAVRRGGINVVVVETACRLSRDVGDLGTLHRLFAHFRVEIHATKTGRMFSSDVALQGFLGQEERRRLARVMMEGRWIAARRGGMIRVSRCYGYVQDPNNRTGLLPDPAEVDVVKRIYREFAEGVAVGTIVRRLNDDGVPAPRGGTWSMTTVLGSGLKRGILEHSLYQGIHEWGRLDCGTPHGESPTTRYPAEHVRIAVPELAVIAPDLAERVNARLLALRERTVAIEREDSGPAKGNGLLSGLVRCSCGAPMSYHRDKNADDRLKCSAVPSCTPRGHQRSIPASPCERTVLQVLRDDLFDDGTLEKFRTESEVAYAEKNVQVEAQLRERRSRIDGLKQKLRSSLDDLIDGNTSGLAAAADRRKWSTQIEDEEIAIAAIELPKKPPALPASVEDLRYALDNWMRRLPFMAATPEEKEQLVRIRSHLVGVTVDLSSHSGFGVRIRIRLHPGDAGGGVVHTSERQISKAARGFMQDGELVSRIERAAKDGVFALDDAMWKTIEPLLLPLAHREPGPRAIADAAVFLAITHMPRKRARACLGFSSASVLMDILQMLGRSGIWAEMVQQLNKAGWPDADRLDPNLYDKRRSSREKNAHEHLCRAIDLLETRRTR